MLVGLSGWGGVEKGESVRNGRMEYNGKKRV